MDEEGASQRYRVGLDLGSSNREMELGSKVEKREFVNNIECKVFLGE